MEISTRFIRKLRKNEKLQRYVPPFLQKMGVGASLVSTSVVETLSGPIRGREIHVDKGIVDAYMGIPYAEPTTGDRRFKKPESVNPWKETRDCFHFGPRCPQHDEYFAQFVNIVGKDEGGCLTLNVLAPRWTRKNSPLPVMVFIHGGGFAVHSSSNYGDVTVARNLCVKDIVFVSINYRLGVFGFFSTGDEHCLGNMGLWDQTMALQWVQDNISKFGGDPGNVTLFGQSAGGASVDLLCLSPHSRDLFHRVIAMAGTGENDFCFHTKEAQVDLSRKFAAHHGFQGNEEDSEAVLKYMRSLPAHKLEVGMTPTKGFHHAYAGNLYFVPNVDGDFFPKSFGELRKEMPRKEVMTGSTEWEGLFFVVMGGFNRHHDPFAKLNKIMIKEYDYGDQTEKMKKQIKDYYMDGVDPKDHHKVIERFTQLMGDYAICAGVWSYANKMTRLGHDVYMYSFDYSNPDGFGWFRYFLPFKGATHCTELRYILGKGIISKFKPNDHDLAMIQTMTTYFANFATYGNPNGIKEGCWEKFKTEEPFRHLSIQYPVAKMADDYCNGRPEFWSKILAHNRTRAQL